jgi:hypothetical protein
VTVVTGSHVRDAAEPDPGSATVVSALYRELLELARDAEAAAALEAARTPYWMPQPEAVAGHRAAARLLRADAERLLATVTG